MCEAPLCGNRGYILENRVADQPQWRDTGAIFSPCGTYRYQLWREWADGPRVVWVMLNPSTADAEVFDPTVRRCYGFSKRWGYGKMSVVNLYALRSTDPKGLWSVDDPVGPDNNAHIRLELSVADLVIAAWGVNAKADRVQAFCELARPYEVRCMGTTRAGCPRHPLYLRNDQGHGLWTRSPV